MTVTRRGRDLEPDIAAADDGQPAPRPELRLEPLRVAQGPQKVHAGKIASGTAQIPWPGPHGEDQPVVADLAAIEHGHRPCRPVDSGHLRAEPQIDPVVSIEIGGP